MLACLFACWLAGWLCFVLLCFVWIGLAWLLFTCHVLGLSCLGLAWLGLAGLGCAGPGWAGLALLCFVLLCFAFLCFARVLCFACLLAGWLDGGLALICVAWIGLATCNFQQTRRRNRSPPEVAPGGGTKQTKFQKLQALSDDRARVRKAFETAGGSSNKHFAIDCSLYHSTQRGGHRTTDGTVFCSSC